MRFFFADSCDYVDPGYNFLTDEYTPERQVQRDDQYSHEFLGRSPYDGILISRAIVGDDYQSGKYSTSQLQRFRRDGAHRFLRFSGPMMGDCGAFSYVNEEKPPYTIEQVVEYYLDAGFTHAVSMDHVILAYDESLDGRLDFAVPEEWRYRYELTLKLAEQFRDYCRDQRVPFHPIGVAQGWSPRSYADAVSRLEELGYDYVALGGLVPLKVYQIESILRTVRDRCPDVRLHLFGFTKADDIDRFVRYRIESFDSTSPMLRAFKDGRRNYLLGKDWYTALRIPDAGECRRFKSGVLASGPDQRRVRDMEQKALDLLRKYDAGATEDVEGVLDALMEYSLEFAGAHEDEKARPEAQRQMRLREEGYRATLRDRPWRRCGCPVCEQLGVEVVIFRGNNRNRRRGMHNLWQFYERLLPLRGEAAGVTREMANAGI